MSDDYLRVIPVDARFVPATDLAQTAVGLLGPALPDADEIVAETYDHPVFIDQGVNLETVICPACSARLSFYPTEKAEAVRKWWHAITDPLDLSTQNVANLRITMYCCGAFVLFSELTYDWPAGVASFEISILNPGIRGSLPEELLVKLESVLGCRVRQVWAHY